MAIELLAENIGKSLLHDKGGVIQKSVTSTDDGIAVALYSTYPILVASWRISNPAAGASIDYRVLVSKEHQPAADDASWEEKVASTALAAGAEVSTSDNEAHYTAIMVVITSTTADTPSADVRVNLLGSV